MGGLLAQLHMQVPPTASRLAPGAHLHWEVPRFGMETRWSVTRTQALWQALHCLDEENAIAALESAIHERFLPPETVRKLGRLAPRRLQPDASQLLANSGSGNETIVRRRLQRSGFRVVAQSPVPGLGHHDLDIEDVLGLEIDGRRWHEDRFAMDRDRDLHSAGLGRRVIRLRPAHIHESWPHTLSVIVRVVKDAQAERDRRFGRVIARLRDPL